MNPPLDDLRTRIDLLDEHMVRLLNARAACALEIGRVKHELGLPIYQPSREVEVLSHVLGHNTGPLDDAAIRRLFERIIDEARHLERIADDKRHGRAPADNAAAGADGTMDVIEDNNAGRRRRE